MWVAVFIFCLGIRKESGKQWQSTFWDQLFSLQFGMKVDIYAVDLLHCKQFCVMQNIMCVCVRVGVCLHNPAIWIDFTSCVTFAYRTPVLTNTVGETQYSFSYSGTAVVKKNPRITGSVLFSGHPADAAGSGSSDTHRSLGDHPCALEWWLLYLLLPPGSLYSLGCKWGFCAAVVVL